MLTIIEEKDFKKIPKSTWDNEGYIYILDFGNFIKIGCTQNPKRRIKQLKSIYREEKTNKNLVLLLSNKHFRFRLSERILHLIFKDFKDHGEFFKISMDDFLLKVNAWGICKYKFDDA